MKALEHGKKKDISQISTIALMCGLGMAEPIKSIKTAIESKRKESKMTKQELIKMTGSEEQANFALKVILKNVQPGFVLKAVEMELDEIDSKIASMEAEGYIVTTNGHKHVNWGKAKSLCGYNLPEEQQAKHDEANRKCAACNSLLYERNRIENVFCHVFKYLFKHLI